ncbi:DUF4365 domain-containing protein [Nocardia puris]|uniref:Uncharacterized protein DUF4365 n=1 Tax=Nocardia puris TaxID=208602 RepID=A0A366DH63_9NOCA|nr:DUF4365 domain-containing protein [Nocardia puris]MBF6213220.1 DUF4365 domain-containing protein [Nocardia puris]MBF6370111.1 DUF4365 domain-containing protein [Nocardia puris]MBF6462099.1 DUF4365 domain-containing protein [Nocardia puris]RBO89403.1 uncharacterized protein DUF4365 [Nocardia puris]
MLDRANHQGKFGTDYVRVLASAAGLIWSQDDVDLDGVDLCLKLPGRTPSGFSPRIDVQVKTVSRLPVRGGHLDYDGLGRAQFDKLAGTGSTVPRYLFVIHVPPRAGEYADLRTAGLLLRHIGYYLPLHDRPPLPATDARGRVRVHIPVGNVLTADGLRALVAGSAIVPA